MPNELNTGKIMLDHDRSTINYERFSATLPDGKKLNLYIDRNKLKYVPAALDVIVQVDESKPEVISTVPGPSFASFREKNDWAFQEGIKFRKEMLELQRETLEQLKQLNRRAATRRKR